MSKDATSKTFLEHIEELRRRLFRVLLALAAGALVSAVFVEQLLEWLARPIGGLEQLEAIEVTENVGVFMQVTLLGGVTLAMPVILYQLWGFVAPGLYLHERRYVYALVPFATFLFVCGVVFAYFAMLPTAIPFLLGFIAIPTRPRPANYFSFVTNMLLLAGLSFETPLVLFYLAKVGIVDYRMLLRNWRIAILMIAVLAAVVTPTPDPLTMSVVMVPLTLLYGLSIVMARVAYQPPAEAD